MGRRRARLALVLCAVVAGTTLAVPAAADPIPDAAYHGIAADGADVSVSVSPDGTLVDSYHITGVQVGQCMMAAAGQKGSWEGAPISRNGFEYNLGDAIHLQGTFSGAQSVSGTFRLYDAATSGSPACDSGTVSFTLTTSSNPPNGGSGGAGPGGSGSGGSGAGSGGSGAGGTVSGGGGTDPGSGGTVSSGGGPGTRGHSGLRRYATRVALHRVSHRRLAGHVSSSLRLCQADRTVILWRGPIRAARGRTTRRGTFTFRARFRLSGRLFRVSVLARTTAAGVCAAGSSISVRG